MEEKDAFNLGFNQGLRNFVMDRHYSNGDMEEAYIYGFECGCKVRESNKYEDSYLYPLQSYNK
jgi:hypothetical protein